MKQCLTILFLTAFAAGLSGQSVTTLDSISLQDPAALVQVTPLAADSLSSSFHIIVGEGMPAHYHAAHTEVVYVLAGEGEMRLGERTLRVKAGDFIHIPRGTVHAVKVTSETPMRVLSVQTPYFDGTDRIWVDTGRKE